MNRKYIVELVEPPFHPPHRRAGPGRGIMPNTAKSCRFAPQPPAPRPSCPLSSRSPQPRALQRRFKHH